MKNLTTILFAFILSAFFVKAQVPNENISNGMFFDGEPYVAVNPNNHRHIVVAWMGAANFKIAIKTTTSFDGGESWSSPAVLPHMSPSFGSADPSLGFDNNGNLYCCYVDFSKVVDSGAVYVAKSTDGGLNWNSPVKAIDMHADGQQRPIDRPWMAVDATNGPYSGNVYVTSMPPLTFGPIPPPYHPYFTRSTDGGGSFMPWRYLDTTGFLAGSQIPGPMPSPVVGPDGRFHASYPSYVPSQNLLPIGILATSSDGGNSISHQSNFAITSGFSDTSAKRASLLRVDPSDPNHLLVVYLATPNGDADVFIRETFDGGQNWGAEQRVNDDPVGNNRMQDMVWAAFGENGDLVVTWRDRRNGTDSTYQTPTEQYAAFRHRDSTNFSKNFRLSDTQISYDVILEEAGNDFMCVDLSEDTITAVWGDVRSGIVTIYMYRASANEGPVSSNAIVEETIPYFDYAPNPFDDQISISTKGLEKVAVFKMNGSMVMEENLDFPADEYTLRFNDLPAGNYILHAQTAFGKASQLIIKH